MTTTAVTWDTGATAKPGPMTVVNPQRAVTDDQLADVAAGTGLNGPFMADLLVSCAAHENMGVNLYKALGAQTQNPMAQKQFAKFRDDSATAVGVHEELMSQLGVPVGYISQVARMTEALDAKVLSAFLLSGSADPMTKEIKGVEASLLASTLCVANTSLLEQICEGLDEGEARNAMRTAIDQLAPVQAEHLEWAARMQHQMVLAQANSSRTQTAANLVETVVGKIKDALH
jgi:hypothetical protein